MHVLLYIKWIHVDYCLVHLDGFRQTTENTLTKPFPSILTISSMQPDFKLPPKIKSIFNGSYI